MHVERDASRPEGVTCWVENLRTLLATPPAPACARRCRNDLARRLDDLSRALSAAERVGRPKRCRHELEMAARLSRRLLRRITKLVAKGLENRSSDSSR
jgi:hypothetical protein